MQYVALHWRNLPSCHDERIDMPLRTRFGERRRAVTSNDASQSVARHFVNGSHFVSNMKILALYPTSGSNDSRK